MSSFTFADNKLGGRLVAACDALGAGHLNKAAGIFAEIADDLNQEATANGLLAEVEPAEDDWSVPLVPQVYGKTPQMAPGQPLFERMQQVAAQATDLQSCARGAHAYGAPDPHTGWRTCGQCGSVNVAPPA